jgi:pimeloyl-ACP methyl ester carboxylesterase
MNKLALALVFVAQTTFAAPRIEEVAVPSHGVVLAGSLVLSGEQPIRAGVVFIHGSGKQARNLDLAKKFAAHGIAALVYDKRGAGQSGGEYEGDQSVSGPNIQLLADDAAAALAVLADHPALKGVPTGLAGISQAGWIAPLAAANNPRAKFLVLWSGPVCKVSEEDIYSKHTTDGDMAAPPPYAEALAARQVPYRWPAFLGRDTDAAADLGKLKIPGLWVFSDNDGSIPVDLSVAKLRVLAAAGHRYDYRVFGGLGHNNIDSTFDTVVEWIRRLPR